MPIGRGSAGFGNMLPLLERQKNRQFGSQVGTLSPGLVGNELASATSPLQVGPEEAMGMLGAGGPWGGGEAFGPGRPSGAIDNMIAGLPQAGAPEIVSGAPPASGEAVSPGNPVVPEPAPVQPPAQGSPEIIGGPVGAPGGGPTSFGPTIDNRTAAGEPVGGGGFGGMGASISDATRGSLAGGGSIIRNMISDLTGNDDFYSGGGLGGSTTQGAPEFESPEPEFDRSGRGRRTPS